MQIQKLKQGSDIRLQAQIRIRRTPEACYGYWRDLENLPRFMAHIESVTVLDDRWSHWRVKAPADTSAEWDAEITEDITGQRISWRSTHEAQIQNEGSVQFTPQSGGGETDVQVILTYHPIGGLFGEVIARLFGETPAQELEWDLSQFKQVLENQKAN